MARGWESKSVEEQQSQSSEDRAAPRPRLSPDELAKRRARDSLSLSRQRILQQIQAAQSPDYLRMLEKALADLDARIAQLG